jgi:HEAT repeat protein
MEQGSSPGQDETGPFEKRMRDQLIRAVREALDPAVRARAALMLGEFGEKDDLEHILPLLEDRDKAVRAAAGRAAAAFGEQVLPQLGRYTGHPDWRVRYRAAEALGFIGGPRARDMLISMLADARDHVRYMAVKGLSGTCTGEIVPSIVPLLSDENEYVRRRAVTVLAGCGGTNVREALSGRLETEGSQPIREEILRFLG